jgi:hypothetical protein
MDPNRGVKMLNLNFKRKMKLTIPIAILALFLIAVTAFAVEQLIIAEEGGVITITEGVYLIVPPEALDEDTMISAEASVKGKRVCFEFGPEGLTFNKPAKLGMTWDTVILLLSNGVYDFMLYGEDGSQITPRITERGIVYNIEHFSLYYFRRR